MFSLAHSVVSSLLSSKGGTIFDSSSKESNILDSSSQFGLGISKEALSVDDSLLALNLGSGVGVSGVGGVGDFSVTGDQISIVLSISGSLLGLFSSDELIDKSNNIINNTFGSEVNL